MEESSAPRWMATGMTHGELALSLLAVADAMFLCAVASTWLVLRRSALSWPSWRELVAAPQLLSALALLLVAVALARFRFAMATLTLLAAALLLPTAANGLTLRNSLPFALFSFASALIVVHLVALAIAMMTQWLPQASRRAASGAMTLLVALFVAGVFAS